MVEKKKTILLIMPSFFNYPHLIMEELYRMGHEVDFYDDRPSTNGFIKAVIRIKKDLINYYIELYFEKILKSIQNKVYDIVLVISGQSLSFDERMFAKLKACQPAAKFVLYQWDSLRNFPYIKKMYPFFDKCYSFDREDVENYQQLCFLPLFYSRDYGEIGKRKFDEFRYDLCFVGTAHPEKYKYIKSMANQLKKIYPKQFIYFFFPSRLVFFYRKIRNKEFRHAQYNEFHYISIKSVELNNLISESTCILDASQIGQVGLTIRVIEALGAKKKLITTNVDVKNYDFYREENIYIYEGGFDFDSVFFHEPYVEIEPEIYKKYSLREWVREIIK